VWNRDGSEPPREAILSMTNLDAITGQPFPVADGYYLRCRRCDWRKKLRGSVLTPFRYPPEPAYTCQDGFGNCPSCGAKKRIYTKHLIARSILLAGVRLKAFENGLRKPFIKLIVTPSFSFKIQRWSYLYRLIDRRHDVYHELVTDPKSNSIIHECKEPLSAHKGHGSARK